MPICACRHRRRTVSLAGRARVTLRWPVARRREADHPFTAAATAILVDVVVRDATAGRSPISPPRTSRSAEDGVAQKVDSFTRVSRGGGIGVGVAWRSPRPITVAADARPVAEARYRDRHRRRRDGGARLRSPVAESLRLAQRATLDYVPMNGDVERPRRRLRHRPRRPRAAALHDRPRRRAAARSLSVIALGTSAADEDKAERADELMARRRELRTQDATATRQPAATAAPRWRATRRVRQRETRTAG